MGSVRERTLRASKEAAVIARGAHHMWQRIAGRGGEEAARGVRPVGEAHGRSNAASSGPRLPHAEPWAQSSASGLARRHSREKRLSGAECESSLKQLGNLSSTTPALEEGRFHPPSVLTETARHQVYQFLSNDKFKLALEHV